MASSSASPGDPAQSAFDEQAYLSAHPDVRQAVAAGQLRSGWDHYEAFGRSEGRELRPSPRPASRSDKLLGGCDVANAVGIEIGPLTTPLVTKGEGAIIYIDHADTETLRTKYRYIGTIDPADIVPVDHVWGDQTLAECIGPDRKVDYVLASHVVEHVPDLVTWLAEIDAVLKPGGSLRLAIPDKRFTFDYLRRNSDLSDALDAFIRRARAPLPRAILDHFINHAEVDALAAWDGALTPDAVRRSHTPAEALAVAERAFRTGTYQDTHCWVFTPASFAAMSAELARLGLLRLACERLYPTEPGAIEFIAVLRATDDPERCVNSWVEAGEGVSAAASPSPRTPPPAGSR